MYMCIHIYTYVCVYMYVWCVFFSCVYRFVNSVTTFMYGLASTADPKLEMNGCNESDKQILRFSAGLCWKQGARPSYS